MPPCFRIAVAAGSKNLDSRMMRLLWILTLATGTVFVSWSIVAQGAMRYKYRSSNKNQEIKSELWKSLMASAMSSGNLSRIPIWPAPLSSRNGSKSLTISANFKILLPRNQRLDILEQAAVRYNKLILGKHALWQSAPNSSELVLDALHVEVPSLNQTLQLGADESYRLQVPHPAKPGIALLQADTVFGALRGLETFSQMCSYNSATRLIQLQSGPWDIFDKPRFGYRGLLIDTSRHYLPLEVIENIIDSMAYAKLNVLHWHIMDEESFPLEVPSFPKLWNGAYTSKERYSMNDAKAIVEYARLRGINVMAEIDVPGHARSWGYGYPELWPSVDCTTPLDVSKNFTFEVISGILSDISKVFRFKLLHLGGDEVNTSCWRDTEHISEWLNSRNMTTEEAYEFFVLEVQKLAMKHGYTPVNWQETFNQFGQRLHRETIVHNWWGVEVPPNVVQEGLKCIVSEQSSWYLDHLDIPWQKFYMYEPFDDIPDEQQQELIVGGEVCMWGETVDASNILQTVWPRAAAAAEKFWSPRNVTSVDPDNMERRLRAFRCLLNERGIPAAPVNAFGRSSPEHFGSCYEQ